MKNHFDEAAKDWDKKDQHTQLSENISTALLNNATFSSEMNIMEFGAGTGLITSAIAPHVSSIAAVDISQAMLDQLVAKEHLQNKVKIYCQDIVKQPLDTSFDAIISAMAVHHVKNTLKLLQSMYDHLNDGGFIALADLDKEDGTFHPSTATGVFHNGFDRSNFKNLLEDAGFHTINFTTAHTFIKENGKSYPIFLAVAHK